MAVLLTVALTAIAWFRLDGTTRGTGWADDREFLQDAVEQGLWSSLFDSYAGYLHVVPRLVVQGVLWVAPFSDVRDRADPGVLPGGRTGGGARLRRAAPR